MSKSTKQGLEAMAKSAMGAGMLTYADLAATLNIGDRTVRRWVAEGTLPPPDLRLRGIVRWRPETIERWLNKQGEKR
ncbi:helix-turn-helix domain-containing protein [Planctomycetales bacterium ZRK34]|nr:helix-turn-helix domain-containing protein [Planctomycetales bacterium ZRK34]